MAGTTIAVIKANRRRCSTVSARMTSPIACDVPDRGVPVGIASCRVSFISSSTALRIGGDC
jgi:hypothetical protein